MPSSRVAEQRRKQRERQRRKRRQTVRQLQQRKQRDLRLVVIGGVVVLAAVLAVVFTRRDDANAGDQTRNVTVTGAALPRFDDTARTDDAVGAAIPTVAGQSFDGTPVNIADDGKAKVLMFVTHWCPHCRAEVPRLAPDLRANPLPANVEMITVSTSVDSAAPNYPPSKWLAGVNWPAPVLADDANSSAAQAYGLSAYPYFVFVDAKNKVVSRTSGEITLDEFHQRVAAIAS